MFETSPHTTATAALLALLAGAPGAALACADASAVYIGTVCTVAFDYCPDGYMSTSGQTLQIQQYNALYALLGTRYGSNGANTFNLPDLRGRVVVGVNPAPLPNLSAFPLAQKRGAEGVALGVNQMAPHSHPATFTGTGGGGASGGGTASGTVSLALSGSTSNIPVTGSVTASALSNQSTGGNATPSAANNTVGKNSLVPMYYPYNAAAAVTSPGGFSLTASGGTLNGTASGTVSLPVTGATGGGITGGTVAVASNATANAPVPLLNPAISLTTCIAVTGLFPPRP